MSGEDPILNRWRERIRAASADRPLCLRGGGSKDFYGQAPRGEVLDTREYRGIVAYEPTELYVTARCGTPLAEIEATLAAQGQMLPCEPPQFGAATLGGCVAAGLSGPRRAAAGAVRDFMLGVRVLDGDGRLLTFGGQVMKNVAGYDVSRLFAGSLGTLGVIAEATLKVLPRPVAETTLRLEMGQAEALAAMNRWAGQPLPISATCWHDGLCTVRLSGARAAVGAAREKLGGETVDTADDYWRELREHRHRFFSGAAPLWRLSLPSVAAAVEIGGTQLIEWGGAQRWLATNADAATLRETAARLGGHATLFRGGDKSVGVFQPLPAPLRALHERLKQSFDARRALNPDRLYPGL